MMIGMLCAVLAAGSSRADCACPTLSLDDRIAGATYIFTGRPIESAQIPQGGSPFHSEQSLEDPRSRQNDLVTLFRIETVWKGEARKTIRVRHEQGECGAQFREDTRTIVFAQADQFGTLWTRLCSGNIGADQAEFSPVEEGLNKRLKFD
jgi:hypothetical protein